MTEDTNKTNGPLVAEVAALRGRVSELEASVAKHTDTEEALRLHSAIAEQVGDSIIVTNLDYKTIYLNQAFQDLYGYDREEFLGRSPDVLNAEPRSSEIQSDIYRAVSSGKVWRGELWNRRKDGTMFPCETTVSPLVDARGETFAYAGAQRDITERRRMEEELKEWKGRYEAAVLASRCVLYDWNSKTDEVVYGGSLREILGYTMAEMDGGLPRWLGLIHPEDRPRFGRDIKAMVEAGRPADLSYRVRRKDGTYVHVTDSGRFFPDSQGNLVRMVGFIRDVTKHKQAEAALRESEERFRSLVENAPNVITIVDRDHRIQFVNHTATGIAKKEVIGRSIHDFVNPEFRDMVSDRVEDVFRTGVHASYECVVKGSWYETQVGPVLHDGTIVAATLISTDITERKQLEARLRDYAENLEEKVERRTATIRELERQRNEMEKLAATGRMAAAVAHEINNPLAGIKNSFLLVKDAVPADHPYHEYAEMIERELNRVSRIVRRMYQLYRTETEEPVSIDIAKTLQETCAAVDAEVKRKRLRLRLDVAADLPAVRLAEQDFIQIVSNLLLNAIQASPAEAELTVAAEQEDGKLRVRVSDRGPGIAPEVLPQVFEPFFSTKQETGEGGMGLGLSISHSLAASMGGTIGVQTEEGKGTTFSLELPSE
jgi:PAS domain S-box-containing protein